MKKINSIHFGGIMIAIGTGLLLLVPLITYLILNKFNPLSLIPGGLVLLSLFIILGIEQIQDNSKVPHYEKDLKKTIPFDKETQIAVIRSSICTGEKTAGFKDKQTGHFREVMIIRSDYDKKRFMDIYDLDDIKIDY